MDRRNNLRNNIFYGNHFQMYDDGSDSDTSDGSNYSPPSSNQSATQTTVWVFGYGSLCWNPGFEFRKCITGYIRGYVRRFWQGNTTHRGTEEKPGRVATLIEDKEGITWGCAYQIYGQAALQYLKQRECTLGGYITQYTKFYPRLASETAEMCGEAFPALLYIATDCNSQWLGEAPTKRIADEVVECSGTSGHNIEYVLRLARFMREELSGAIDEHLFELEQFIMETMRKEKISLMSVMGSEPQRIQRDSHQHIQRPQSFEYRSRVADKKLRCLEI